MEAWRCAGGRERLQPASRSGLAESFVVWTQLEAAVSFCKRLPRPLKAMCTVEFWDTLVHRETMAGSGKSSFQHHIYRDIFKTLYVQMQHALFLLELPVCA